MKTTVALVITVLIACATSPAAAASPEQIATARVRALAWLLAGQASDGSWRSAVGAEVVTTATAVDALRAAGVTTYPYAAGIAWLGNARPSSVDGLARQIAALQPAGVDVAPAAARLAQWRNRALAWGAYDNFDSSFPDTTLAIGALRLAGPEFSEADVTTALCVVLNAQKTGDATVAGSWSWMPAVPFVFGTTPSAASAVGSAAIPTALNVLEIAAIGAAKGWTSRSCGPTYQFATVTTTGLNWLVAFRRNADGGFGEAGTSRVFDTAMVYRALAMLRPADPAISAALDFLIARQSPDGSWNADALQTAAVVVVLGTPPAPLIDTDGDGIPDAVEVLLGKNPSVADSRWAARSGVNPVGGGTRAPSLAPVTTIPAVVLAPPAGDGDLNGDGVVDAADVAIAERIALGVLTPTAAHLSHGDIAPATTPDGVIDVADVARIRRRALGLEGP